MSDTEQQNDPYFAGARRRKFSNWFIKNKEKYLERLQKYKDNLENSNREDYKSVRENHVDFNTETMDLLRNREAESYVTNFTELTDDISLGNLRDERDREMNFERRNFNQHKDNSNQFNFDRENFNTNDHDNNQHQNQ